MTLQSIEADYEALTEVTCSARNGTKSVKVPLESLERILSDFSILYGKHVGRSLPTRRSNE